MHTTMQSIINAVLTLPTLEPSPTVNRVMTDLVDMVIESKPRAIRTIDAATIQKIRSTSSAAESEMEKFWARLIAESSHPKEVLAAFPYLRNYEELTRRELALVASSGLSINSAHRILVIGSGPLPLSAYEIYRQTGATVDHVDSSPEAMELCMAITKALGMESVYITAEGQSVVLKATYDLILIAALAGDTTTDKQAIIDTIAPHLSEYGRIIVRSARGSRQLLYPAIASTSLKQVRLLKEYHPTDDIINSVFVYAK